MFFTDEELDYVTRNLENEDSSGDSQRLHASILAKVKRDGDWPPSVQAAVDLPNELDARRYRWLRDSGILQSADVVRAVEELSNTHDAGWQPIVRDGRLPDNRERVLFVYRGQVLVGEFLDASTPHNPLRLFMGGLDIDFKSDEISHWMSMPEPPK